MPIRRQSTCDRFSYQRISKSDSKIRENRPKQLISEDTAKEENNRLDKLASVHSELQQVFNLSQARHAEDGEQSRHVHQFNLNRVHEEMRRLSHGKSKKDEMEYLTEQERKRRISFMEELLCSNHPIAKEMMETNSRLSIVHDDLKEAFRKREIVLQDMECKKKQHREELKQMVLEEIRRKFSVKYVNNLADREQQDRVTEYDFRLRDKNFFEFDRKLMTVQEHMLSLFRKLKNQQHQKEQVMKYTTLDLKQHVHEQLISESNRKTARRLSMEEQYFRIKDKKYATPDESARQRKSIVHQQLLQQHQH